MFYLSSKFPRKKIIAIEPFKNGVANIAHYALENKIKNIFIFPFVFQKFLKKYKNFSFEQCYIFFPDPWPKKRHHKRRLINYVTLLELIKRCNKKGEIYFGSDNEHYFENVYDCAKDLKKIMDIKLKKTKKTPTTHTKYHRRAQKLKNNINFLKIAKS